MNYSDFKIGTEFTTDDANKKWRCTDIGTRVIVAMRIDRVEISTSTGGKNKYRVVSEAEAEAEGWFNGPPYAIVERVFDEDDQQGCQPVGIKFTRF